MDNPEDNFIARPVGEEQPKEKKTQTQTDLRLHFPQAQDRAGWRSD